MNLEQVEDAIDNGVVDTVEQLLAHFCSERRRILTAIRDLPEKSTLSYSLNREFEYLVARLVNAQFGEIESSSLPAPITDRKRRGSIPTSEKIGYSYEKVADGHHENGSTSPQASSSSSIATLKKGKKSKIEGASDYANLQVVGILTGKDSLGERITGPSPLIAIQDKQCFIVLHDDKLSVLSPTTEILATYSVIMAPSYSTRTSQGIRFSAFIKEREQLLLFDRGDIKTIDLSPIFDREEGAVDIILEAKIRIENLAGFGLAVSEETHQFFTRVDECLVAFSFVLALNPP